MLAKQFPENKKRLAVLRGLGVLDSGTEQVYDDITQLTAELCEAPLCLVSLVEEDRQWFKSEFGLGICETKIEQSVCAHAIAQNNYLEIQDTHLDDRTFDNTLCQGDKAIRFYAGAILRTIEGWPLGTLCVLDYKPRTLSKLQQRILKVHATSITRQLEFTRMLLEQANLTSKSTPPFEHSNQEFIHEKLRLFKTLTPRETEIMRLIAGRSGNLSSKKIAQELNISHRTVDHHRAKILSKMAVGSVAELIAVSINAKIFKS